MINIPAAVISDEQLAHLRTGIERSRRPEHVQEVIARGRKLMEIEAERRAGGQS